MIIAPHFLAGAAAAGYIDEPLLLFAAAILIHIVLDLIPHWDYVKGKEKLKNKVHYVALDLAVGPLIMLSTLFIAGETDIWKISWYMLGGILANIPDFLTLLFIFLPKSKILKTIFDLHQKLHIVKHPDWKIGIPPQIAVMVISLLLIINLC